MTRRPRPRPRIFKLCVFILALASGGAIINVAVAWGIPIYHTIHIKLSLVEIWGGSIGSGYPFESLQRTMLLQGYDLSRGSRLSNAWEHGFGLRGPLWVIGGPTRLPIRPIWPGFAINTLFYAAILWLLFAAPGFIRARARRKRGLCPACAYPIGTNPVCTECGTALPRAIPLPLEGGVRVGVSRAIESNQPILQSTHPLTPLPAREGGT